MSDYAAIIVTNDNLDGTDLLLSTWRQLDSRHHVISVDGLAAAYPNRIDRLAVARNFYLRKLLDFDNVQASLILIADFDGPNIGLTPQVIEQALASAPHCWDALFANQERAYYDLYALRHNEWCPADVWAEVEKETKFPFRSHRRQRAIQRLVHERQYRIALDHPVIPVKSAFGGLGIYRRNALSGCWYGSREACGQTVCEHVVIHRQMEVKGAKLFIMPSLLNLAPEAHLGPSSGEDYPY